MDQFRPPPAQINRKRKATHLKSGSGRGASTNTVSKRIKEHPNDKLSLANGQLWCGLCQCNVGSGKQACAKHCGGQGHLAKKSAAGSALALWSPATHELYPAAARAYAVQMMLMGHCSTRVPVEVWMANVMPHLVSWESVLAGGISTGRMQ